MNCSDYEKLVFVNPNAQLSDKSRGRKKKIDSDGLRSEFQRDIHRIIYSQPFRRLRHKTQVFFLPNNDHICTRMEHVLYVSSASRTVARELGLNEDLAEAIGLGHDLGHAPFGHHGESVLNEISLDQLKKVFQHEIHGLRVVDKLAEFDRDPEPGLDLTYEVRDGILSHCGEARERIIIPAKSKPDLDSITDKRNALMPSTFEGCIVRIVDKIAYAGRDIEDALISGQIKEENIPQEIVGILGKNNGQIVRKLLKDLISFCKNNPGKVGLSDDKHHALKKLIRFNNEYIYTNNEIEKYKPQAKSAIEILYERLLKDLEKSDRFKDTKYPLPKEKVYEVFKKYLKKIKYPEKEKDARIVLDFIAGMTDNYLISCVNQIFVPKSVV